MDKTLVDSWLKDNSIGFVSDMFNADSDADKTRFELGVQGLPWLILTDKDRNVLAEGFDVSDIAAATEKLK